MCACVSLRWLLELYVSPSQVTFYVALSAAAGLAALALPILALHCREKAHTCVLTQAPFPALSYLQCLAKQNEFAPFSTVNVEK